MLGYRCAHEEWVSLHIAFVLQRAQRSQLRTPWQCCPRFWALWGWDLIFTAPKLRRLVYQGQDVNTGHRWWGSIFLSQTVHFLQWSHGRSEEKRINALKIFVKVIIAFKNTAHSWSYHTRKLFCKYLNKQPMQIFVLSLSFLQFFPFILLRLLIPFLPPSSSSFFYVWNLCEIFFSFWL